MFKRIYLLLASILFIISVYLGVDRIYHGGSGHFCLKKIRTSNLFSPHWSTPPLSLGEKEKLKEIFNQKFVLYEKGARSYECLSEDGKYVLKFLKYQHLRPSSWLAYIPLSANPYYQEFLFKKKRCESLMKGWHCAFSELQEETGLIYMHMHNAQPLNQTVVILGRDEQEYRVCLDKTLFCVQEHAQLTYLRIAELMHQGDILGAKQVVDSIFSLIDSLNQKGVLNQDFVSQFNFGLVNDRAIQIDLGKLRTGPLCGCQKQWIPPMAEKTQRWLERTYPELALYFEGHIAARTVD